MYNIYILALVRHAFCVRESQTNTLLLSERSGSSQGSLINAVGGGKIKILIVLQNLRSDEISDQGGEKLRALAKK